MSSFTKIDQLKDVIKLQAVALASLTPNLYKSEWNFDPLEKTARLSLSWLEIWIFWVLIVHDWR